MLTVKRQIAGKIETTNGTAIALAAADADMWVIDPVMRMEAEHIPRLAGASSTPRKGSIGARGGICMFTLEAEGKGAAGSPEWANLLLPACGFYDDANTWKLVTAVPSTAGNVPRTITLAKFTDGRKMILSGCMGNAVFRFVHGRPLMIDFTFRGKYESMTDVALLAATLPTQFAPAVTNTTFTIGGVALRTGEVTIDLGNNVIMRPDIGSGAGTSGFAYATISGRDIRVRLDQEAALVATRDDYGILLAGTQQAMVLNVGGATWNELDFSLPKIQFATLEDRDQEGMLMDGIEAQAQWSAAEDDEMTLAFVSG
jgi:hypothetical protein